MEEDKPLADFNYILFAIELVLNILTVPIMIFVIWWIIRWKALHSNFRFLLHLNMLTNVVLTLIRSFIIIYRIAYLHLNNNLFITYISHVQYFWGTLSMFAWAALVFERTAASLKPARYEAQCSKFYLSLAISTSIMMFCLMITLLRFFYLVSGIELKVLYTQLVVLAGTVVGLIYIVLFNVSLYRRHEIASGYLGTRYQLVENIRTTKFVLPAVVITLVFRIIYSCLIYYSINYTNIPLGQDTGPIMHAYDLLSAVSRIACAVWLAQAAYRRMGTGKNCASVGQAQPEYAQQRYFQELQRQWA